MSKDKEDQSNKLLLHIKGVIIPDKLNTPLDVQTFFS